MILNEYPYIFQLNTWKTGDQGISFSKTMANLSGTRKNQALKPTWTISSITSRLKTAKSSLQTDPKSSLLAYEVSILPQLWKELFMLKQKKKGKLIFNFLSTDDLSNIYFSWGWGNSGLRSTNNSWNHVTQFQEWWLFF